MKRTRVRSDRNAAAFSRLCHQPMSSTHSMNARKCVYAQKLYPSQAFERESAGQRKRNRDRKDRGQEADGKIDQQNKHIVGTKSLKQGLPIK